jgi:MFS family permease
MCTPTAFSLIADYYPPEKRTTTNAIYSLGIYVGTAISSLTTLMIDAYGWRNAFFLLGIIGGGLTLFGFFFIKEVNRGGFDKKLP